jgi:acyl carrier protein
MNNLLRILFATILSSAAIAQEIINTDQIVLENTSEILKIPTSKLKIEESFYNQISPGEYVDIIEIAMGIEEKLGIVIPEDDLNNLAGAHDLSDSEYGKRVTIKELQQLVKTVYLRQVGT